MYPMGTAHRSVRVYSLICEDWDAVMALTFIESLSVEGKRGLIGT